MYNRNGEEIQERFLFVLHHVMNRHVFTENTYYKKSDRDPYSREEDESQWMHMGEPAHNILKLIIQVPQSVKDEHFYHIFRSSKKIFDKIK